MVTTEARETSQEHQSSSEERFQIAKDLIHKGQATLSQVPEFSQKLVERYFHPRTLADASGDSVLSRRGILFKHSNAFYEVVYNEYIPNVDLVSNILFEEQKELEMGKKETIDDETWVEEIAVAYTDLRKNGGFVNQEGDISYFRYPFDPTKVTSRFDDPRIERYSNNELAAERIQKFFAGLTPEK